jgi:hypothetical protein
MNCLQSHTQRLRGPLRRHWGSVLLLMLVLHSVLVLPGMAQTKVQVVTRTIEQTLPCPAGMLVRIKAEKANLRVQGWDKPSVQVTLRLIARHPEREIAEKELPSVRYHIGTSGTTIDLMNYFALPAGAPAIRSDLRAEYIVMMPANNYLEAVNAYGQTTLIGLTSYQKLEQDFGKIALQDLRGHLQATIRYADITGDNLNLNFTCDADKSALRLTDAAGSYTIRNRYGSVSLEPTAELKSAFIDAVRTEVHLQVPQLSLFSYNLSTTQSTLTVPASLRETVRQTTGRQSLRQDGSPRAPLIRVQTTYAPVTLQNQPLLIKQ